MDIGAFVKNVKYYCSAKGIKPTNACRESGAGKSLIDQMERRGSIPSVEKVHQLAQYLGVTTSELLGETASGVPKSGIGPPAELGLHDSAIRLKVDEVEMILAYRRADADDRVIVDAALRKYREKETTTGAG